MFDRSVYSIPLGTDFAEAFVDGLLFRIDDPIKLAQTRVFVNTERTKRRLIDLFIARGPRLLPKIDTLSALVNDPFSFCPQVSTEPLIHAQLRLAHLVRALLVQKPDLAPKSAVFDLASNLQALIEEAHGEQVQLDKIADVDVGEYSEQWKLTKEFLKILGQFETDTDLRTAPASIHINIDHYEEVWRNSPPDFPIIIAGSTGSRWQSLRFMKLLKTLPNTAIVLPGVDPNLSDIWDIFEPEHPNLDHPQGVLAKTIRALDESPQTLGEWSNRKPSDRLDLLSLALVPAPVTDQWQSQGQSLRPHLSKMVSQWGLLEADNEQTEAVAIAMMLRKAVDADQHAALISPNRVLTRRVSALLKQWNILPDDSAGQPLHLTPEAILLRLLASGFGRALQPEYAMALLRHASVHRGQDAAKNRKAHALIVQDLDVHLRRKSPTSFVIQAIKAWAEKRSPETLIWVEWMTRCLSPLPDFENATVSDWADILVAQTNALTGTFDEDPSDFWANEVGEKILEKLDGLKTAGDRTILSAFEFSQLFQNLLDDEIPSDPSRAHPNVSIWGTLEARVQGADLVILGGLNEGVWPKAEDTDLWLNRDMRKQLGLLPPERRTGLSAYDFQQAACAKEVMFTRSLRDAEAQTTPSRWLLRITNLLSGLDKEGETALDEMRMRGHEYVALAQAFQKPRESKKVEAATRPAPVLPPDQTLSELSVTEVKTLVKDPYEIYAKRILGLRKLDDLGRDANALDRGNLIHETIESFTHGDKDWTKDDLKLGDAFDRFVAVLDEKLGANPAPNSSRALWRAGVLRVLNWFLEGEADRRAKGTSLVIEGMGEHHFPDLNLTLRTRADRIDQGDSGVRIYDYKGGNPPSSSDIRKGDQQLSMMALIARAGGFQGVTSEAVEAAEFIGFHRDEKITAENAVSKDDLDAVEAAFKSLIRHYAEGGGFVARDRPEDNNFFKPDFEQLSRFSEWTDADDPTEMDMS